MIFPPVSYRVVLLVFRLMSLGPGTWESWSWSCKLSVDNKCAVTLLVESLVWSTQLLSCAQLVLGWGGHHLILF